MHYTEEELKQTGIYCIYCKVTGFTYYGSAGSKNIKKGFKERWSRHLTDLKISRHHSYSLQRDWKRYTPDDFAFLICEICPPEECIKREQIYLDYKGVGEVNESYNTCPNATSSLGIRHTKQSLEKISVNRKKAEKNRTEIAKEANRVHLSKLRSKLVNDRKNISDKRNARYLVTTPDGTQFCTNQLSTVCEKNKLCYAAMFGVTQGVVNQHLGWHCYKLSNTDDGSGCYARCYLLQKRLDNPSNYLTKKEILQIVEQAKQGHTQKQLADLYKVNKFTIKQILQGKTWSFITGIKDIPISISRLPKYLLTSPEGLQLCSTSLTNTASIFGLTRANLLAVAGGRRKHHKGWGCEKIEEMYDE